MYAVGAPGNYRLLLAPLPDGVKMVRTLTRDVDIVHVFATTRKELATQVRKSMRAMRPDAAIWVSWPKLSSKVASDIREDVIRAVALPLGLVDIKVCAVDETWSGLKLVVRKENRR